MSCSMLDYRPKPSRYDLDGANFSWRYKALSNRNVIHNIEYAIY